MLLLHQGIGLEAFNELPPAKASHALYECCNSVIMAADLAAGRPYADRYTFLRASDAVLFGLSESSIDDILEAYGLHHNRDTDRAVLRGEIARINRSRFERMLGPEGGFDNWS